MRPQVFQSIVGDHNAEPLAGGLKQADAKALELANKSGMTKQVMKQVSDTAVAPAKQRTLQLLLEGICLLTMLSPPSGDLDPKGGDAVSHVTQRNGM